MSRTAYTVVLFSLLGGVGAFAADTKVLDHHVANMKSGSLEGVLSDYAPDAVVITPPGMVSASGVFVGVTSIWQIPVTRIRLPG